jgi:hypothetical protein
MPKVVMRFTHTAKPGCRGELAQLVKDQIERLGLAPRVLLPSFTSTDWGKVTTEVDFDTEQERREFWDNLDWSDPQSVEYERKVSELTLGFSREMFFLLT